MRWIVDGMNVVGSRPDGWWRDRTGAMRRLADRLDRLAAETGEPVTVVFDGAERDLGPLRTVTVRFAPGGRDAADHAIAALVEADDDPASLTVVTSDRELVDRVRAAGAAVQPAGTLLRRLDEL
jgi:uncharacterized protein YaiI (UPF0178 family)